MPSLFISASKSLDVCLFFASKSMNERKIDHKNLRIAEIMLDLSKGKIWDLSCERNRLKLGIEKGTTKYIMQNVLKKLTIFYAYVNCT